MSLKHFSVSDLYEIASKIAAAKTNALISKYYNQILVAAHEGKFNITFHMSTREDGEVCPEEWVAMDAVENFFQGIKTSYDYIDYSYTFSWHKYN